MPQTRTVQVGVSLSDNPTAKLEIRVKPWAVVLHEGGTLLVGLNSLRLLKK